MLGVTPAALCPTPCLRDCPAQGPVFKCDCIRRAATDGPERQRACQHRPRRTCIGQLFPDTRGPRRARQNAAAGGSEAGRTGCCGTRLRVLATRVRRRDKRSGASSSLEQCRVHHRGSGGSGIHPADTREVVDLWVPLQQATHLGERWARHFGCGLVVVDGSGSAAARCPQRTKPQAAMKVWFVNETTRGAKPAWKKTQDPRLYLLSCAKRADGISRSVRGASLFYSWPQSG